MTHQELKERVAEKAGINKAQAEAAIRAYIEGIEEALINDLEARVLGIGTLKVKVRAARVGVNPQTREKIEIPASLNVRLSVSKSMKKKINEALTVEDVKNRLGK